MKRSEFTSNWIRPKCKVCNKEIFRSKGKGFCSLGCHLYSRLGNKRDISRPGSLKDKWNTVPKWMVGTVAGVIIVSVWFIAVVMNA